MDKEKTPEQLLFDMFLNAVKRKDKRQFSYFNLYFAIKHADDMKVENENSKAETKTEEMVV